MPTFTQLVRAKHRILGARRAQRQPVSQYQREADRQLSAIQGLVAEIQSLQAETAILQAQTAQNLREARETLQKI